LLRGSHILDVRKDSEIPFRNIVEADAENAPLDYITDSMLKINLSDTNFTTIHSLPGGYKIMVI